MARKKSIATETLVEDATTTEEAAAMRRCIGSARFAIRAHDAPVAEFPLQPSQKDGLGRMCKVHWNAYTAGLARDAKARKAAAHPVAEEAVTGATVEGTNAGEVPAV